MVLGCKRFGHYLRALREARRLTLEDVERLTLEEPEPVTRSLLSRLENGRARISTLKLMALSRLYRVRLGLLAERLELDHELERLEHEKVESWPPDELLAQAAQAGGSGQVHRALLLYEQAELRSLEAGGDANVRVRARLGVARALAADSRFRTARSVLEDVLGEKLDDVHRAWAFFLLARTSLHLEQPLLANAAFLSLQQVPRPWPPEIDAAAPGLEAELLMADGKLEQACTTWLAALDAARRSTNTQFETYAMLRLGETERRRARLGPAADWNRRARSAAEAAGLTQLLVQALIEEGRIACARRRADVARATWTQARRLARRLDLHGELFSIYLELWRLAARENNANESRAALRALRHAARFLETLPAEAQDAREHLELFRGYGRPAEKEVGA
ncbi:MAG: helix-turn-helix transcriptional regulator [Acidobacteria bacterium]|nr:helix-turn-helix transcriptional regulator [Acidobacteriota bacterium]